MELNDNTAVRTQTETAEAAPVKAPSPGRAWFWIFCLTMAWVYAMRSCSAFIIVMTSMEQHFMAVGIFQYPVNILGICAIPALLDRIGIGLDPKKNRAAFLCLTAASLALFALLCYAPLPKILPLELTLFYLLNLFPSVMMGMALRRGVLLWDPQKSVLYVGGAFLCYEIFDVLNYYSFIATQNLFFYWYFSLASFSLPLIAALVIRLRVKDDSVRAMPASGDAYPAPFVRGVCAMLVLHALFSTAINTVYFFDNMDDFHTIGYEVFFHCLAIAVIGAATWLLFKRRWLIVSATCLLVLCLGQGMTLFGIESMPLAIGYNLTCMVTKMPLHILSLALPVYYCTARRKPGALLSMSFGLTSFVDFLLMLTQLTPEGLSAIPRQGALLLVGLVLTGLLFYYYLRFEKMRTDALLASIKESQKLQKTPKETLGELNLTPREHEIAGLLLDGDSSKIIASKLHIAHATVTFHTKNLYRKLNIQSRSELFALFLPS